MTTDRCDRADCRAERHQHANDLGGVQLAALRLALGEAPPDTVEDAKARVAWLTDEPSGEVLRPEVRERFEREERERGAA